MNTETKTRWQQILIEAVSKKGSVLKAYSAFYNYSLFNMLYAYLQCLGMEIEPGALNTYKGWQNLGRQVKKGAKALELCVPHITKTKADEADTGDEAHAHIFFTFKRRWFVLSQTTGVEIEFYGTREWNKEQALRTLNIIEKPFQMLNGNVQGYARENAVAISPIAVFPHKTLFHELAHIVLGHTKETAFSDAETIPRNIKEVEAESVALLLCDALNLEGAEFSRGYIQLWLKSEEIPETSAKKIFSAADKILKAGTIQEAE